MLNQRDKDMIADYIGTYASRMDNYYKPDINNVLHFWEEAKSKYLMNMFGDNLILEREIDYVASPEQLVQIFNSVNRPTYKFYDELYRLFFYTKEFDPLIRDWSDNEEFSAGRGNYSTYTYLSDRATLMDNVWRLGPKVFPLPNGRSFKVQPGTKISRIFSKLTKEWQLPEASWEHVRESQAIALSSRHFKGTLCLSIHPMDYMTMSDNEENWRSCMAWGLDNHHFGEYRCGTVEMMNSPYVVVAYVKNPNRFIFDDQWNSKMWRELFVVHPQAIVNVMAYPVNNTFLTKYVLDWLKELAEKANVNVYADKMESPAEDRLYMTTNYMYNDCYRDEQFVYYAKDAAPDKMITINYSGVLNCMVCGKIFEPHGSIEDSDCAESALICDDCEPYHIAYCANCNARIYSEDECYWVDGDAYCRCCYEDHVIVPYGDDEEAMDYNCSELYIKLPDDTSMSPDCVLCRDMYSAADTLENVPDTTYKRQLIHSHHEAYHNYYYVEYKYAPRELKEACGLTNEDIQFWDEYLYTLENPRPIEDKSTKWDKYLQRVQDHIASMFGKNAD